MTARINIPHAGGRRIGGPVSRRSLLAAGVASAALAAGVTFAALAGSGGTDPVPARTDAASQASAGAADPGVASVERSALLDGVAFDAAVADAVRDIGRRSVD